MADKIKDADLAAAKAQVGKVVVPASSRGTSGARICRRCMARNVTGETFCKVCGEPLPKAAADVEAEATRRLAPEVAQASLVVHGSGGDSMIVRLEKDIQLVGRSSLLDRIYPDVDLASFDRDNYVSRRHAFIVRRFGGFAIEDLESVNGTFINGIQRAMPHALMPLADGDEVMFGQTRCTFKADPL